MDRKTFSFREQLEAGLRRTMSRNAAARQSTDNLEAQARQTQDSIVTPAASQEGRAPGTVAALQDRARSLLLVVHILFRRLQTQKMIAMPKDSGEAGS